MQGCRRQWLPSFVCLKLSLFFILSLGLYLGHNYDFSVPHTCHPPLTRLPPLLSEVSSWGRKHFPLPVVQLSSLSWCVTVSPPRPCGLRPCFHSAAGDSRSFLSLCLCDFHPSGEILSRFLLRYRFCGILRDASHPHVGLSPCVDMSPLCISPPFISPCSFLNIF